MNTRPATDLEPNQWGLVSTRADDKQAKAKTNQTVMLARSQCFRRFTFACCWNRRLSIPKTAGGFIAVAILDLILLGFSE